MKTDRGDRQGGEPEGASFPEDEAIDLSDVRWIDSIVLIVFWILAGVVFLQFFTRYVLNDSLGWTEEIARYLLIAVTFAGSVIAVRNHAHIAVEFLYRWVPKPARRLAQTLIDLASIAFYAWLTFLTTDVAQLTFQKMTSLNVSKSVVYWGVAACFAGMTLYAVLATWRHLRTGTSRLIDPQSHEADMRGID